MNSVLNYLQRLMCHKNQPTNQYIYLGDFYNNLPTRYPADTWMQMTLVTYPSIESFFFFANL